MSEHSAVRFLAATILLVGISAFARLGEVEMLTGELVQGHVRVMPDRIVVANGALGTVYTVASTNVARISFFPVDIASTASHEAIEGPADGWREADIGRARFPGSTRHEGNAFTLRSAGMNIDGDADSFHFVFKPVTGDSEIVAQIPSIHYTHADAKAGLMMRESLHDHSRNVTLALTALRGGAFQFRMADRGYTEALALPRAFAPQWLKLRRRGNEFSAFISPNGRAWSLIEKVTLAMSENFYVGLALAGAQDGVLNWTTFARVRVGRRLLSEDFTPVVQLASGSQVRGWPDSGNSEEILFAGGPKVVRVPTSRVARIAFQPLWGDLAWRARVSRPGVFVGNGDFVDGDFRGLGEGKVTISSVLYGLRTFDVGDEALAVILQPRRWSAARYEAELADGSLLLASGFTLGRGEVHLQEPVLGEVRVPAFEIIELRRR